MNRSSKQTGSHLIWGALLILAGLLFLIQNLGWLRIGDLFWGLLLLAGGGFFLSLFARERSSWWALIPGITLLGIAAAIFWGLIAPDLAEKWSGAIVLSGIGLSFLGVYLAEPKNWWAIIPCGVLLTLAATAALAHFLPDTTNLGVFFLGIGLTFAILALLPSQQGQMTWGWIPAAILLLVGAIFMISSERLLNYLWPAVLILLGLFLIVRTAIKKS